MKKNWIPYPRYIFRKELALKLIKENIEKNSRFLEIGCASGDFGITLAKRGYSGLMIDFSENAEKEVMKNLQNIKNSKVNFQKSNLFDLKERNKFDFILLFEVLEHIKKDKKALRKLYNLLPKNGFLLLSVPSKRKLWGPSDILAGHQRRYSKKGLRSLLSKCGFKIMKLYSYGFPWLNWIKILRDRFAKKALLKIENKTFSSKEKLTKESGLNPIKNFYLQNISRFFFNRYSLFIPMQISDIFNNFDLAEGYLCLTKKL